jgi:hypothetical protein
VFYQWRCSWVKSSFQAGKTNILPPKCGQPIDGVHLIRYFCGLMAWVWFLFWTHSSCEESVHTLIVTCCSLCQWSRTRISFRQTDVSHIDSHVLWNPNFVQNIVFTSLFTILVKKKKCLCFWGILIGSDLYSLLLGNYYPLFFANHQVFLKQLSVMSTEEEVFVLLQSPVLFMLRVRRNKSSCLDWDTNHGSLDLIALTSVHAR